MSLLKKTLVLIALLVAIVPVMAQKAEVKINKIKQDTQRSPAYHESLKGSAGAKNYWWRGDLEFETKTKKGWINELEVRWLVCVVIDGSKKVAALQQTATFVDVEDGKHVVCAYIGPKFFERYMTSKRSEKNKISIYAEIWVDGQRLAREEEKASMMPSDWFKKVDAMLQFPNVLLPKSKTPFAPMDYDYFEVEKVN